MLKDLADKEAEKKTKSTQQLITMFGPRAATTASVTGIRVAGQRDLAMETWIELIVIQNLSVRDVDDAL